jgi:hypothetical protein
VKGYRCKEEGVIQITPSVQISVKRYRFEQEGVI